MYPFNLGTLNERNMVEYGPNRGINYQSSHLRYHPYLNTTTTTTTTINVSSNINPFSNVNHYVINISPTNRNNNNTPTTSHHNINRNDILPINPINSINSINSINPVHIIPVTTSNNIINDYDIQLNSDYKRNNINNNNNIDRINRINRNNNNNNNNNGNIGGNSDEDNDVILIKNPDMTGWSQARKEAWNKKDTNPNGYYYRFNKIGEAQIFGKFDHNECKKFMKKLKKYGANNEWGLFSKNISGRVGYVCANHYRELIKSKYIHDPNYTFDKNGKLKFIREKFITKEFKKYGFTINKVK